MTKSRNARLVKLIDKLEDLKDEILLQQHDYVAGCEVGCLTAAIEALSYIVEPV